MNQELYEKITQKKEFSQLPRKDVELAMEKFEKKNLNEWQMIKLTRQFLRKIYSSFSSRKVFSSKQKPRDWYLMKHKSSKERFPYYNEVYERIFKGFDRFSVIDLGSGINGLSFLPSSNPQPPTPSKQNKKITSRITNYIAVEAIGQFVELMNDFFKRQKFNGKAIHLSLFDLREIKEIIKEQKKPRVVLLFKVIDSLEIVKRDYSKELLKEITPLGDRIIVSFATRSLGSGRKFSAKRNWLLKFISENFEISDDFEIGGERYLVFRNKD